MREGVNPRKKSNKRSISEGQRTPESMGSCCYLVVFIPDNAFFCKWRARDWLAMMMKKSTTVAALGNTAMFGNGHRTRYRKGQSLEWKGFYSCSLHSKKRSKWQQHRPNFAGFSCIETTYHGGKCSRD